MITTIHKNQLAETGGRYRGNYLVEQARYTLAQAAGNAAIAAALPQGFLAEAEGLVGQVEEGFLIRVNLAAEAKDATRVQNGTLRLFREWRRRLAALGRMARRAGAPVPEALTAVGAAGRSVPAALDSLRGAIGLLRENAKLFEAFPLYVATLGEAESLAASLATVDAVQEAKRLSELPAAVRKYYAAKGLLLVALKMIQDAARAVHADDPPAAARFNLSILYRRGNHPRPPAPPAA